jgi:hypothetical protein
LVRGFFQIPGILGVYPDLKVKAPPSTGEPVVQAELTGHCAMTGKAYYSLGNPSVINLVIITLRYKWQRGQKRISFST